jgi:hypothetical protein
MAKIIEDGVDAKAANEILIGMVTDDTVLGRIASKWKHKPFDCEWADVIGQWCVTFFQKHRKAPSKTIRSLYDQWAESQPSDTLVKGVEQFLKHLSEQAVKQGEVNPGHVLDIATKHFHKVGLTRLRDVIDDGLETGQYDRVDAKLTEFNKLDLVANTVVDVNADEAENTFRSRPIPIIKYPGDLGIMVNDSMTRSNLIAFMGAEKSGKSWTLLDAAFRAVTQRRKVMYFEVGDMSREQTMQRFYSRVCQTPFRSPSSKWPYTVKYPDSICPPEKGKDFASVTTATKTFAKALDATVANSRWEKHIKKNKLPDLPIRFSFSSAGTMTVAGIASQLDSLAIDGWTPDVLVIDYADILGTVGSKRDERDGINSVWLEMRSLAMSRNLLIITATQANAASYTTKLLSRENFSGDKRKLAHATGVLGINVPLREKSAGITKINWIVRRDAEHNPGEVVHCAGCLAIASPIMRSCF